MVLDPMTQDPFDDLLFRRVLGHNPTGVCVVTAVDDEGPVALVVGTFTSVSLDPPLVGFLPKRSSRSWQRIEAAGHFCVSVLSDDQLGLCHAIGEKSPRLFEEMLHRPSLAGAPMIEGALAWIDCRVRDIHEAGDHIIVVAHVLGLAAREDSGPLLFFRGGYGRFSALAATPFRATLPGTIPQDAGSAR
jgi:flavin reductase (DIM6/NTAB) family NADH-FMN oxidoreductase RutF